MRLSVSKERVFGLDLMRAMAITLVLMGHSLWIYPNANPYISSILQVFAFLGVEIFFVLSGFLIGGILYRLYVEQEFTLSSVFYFLKRRWFRTLPAYYLVLIVNTSIALFYGTLQQEYWKYGLFLQNFNTPMPAFFPESWSLSVEEFSYLLLPFSLFVFGQLRKPKNRSRFFIVVVGVLILVAMLAKLQFHCASDNKDIAIWNSDLKSVVIYRFDAILIGVACSWLALNAASFWKKFSRILAIVGFIYLAFLFVGIGYFRLLIDTHPLFWNVFYLPLVSLAIAFFLPVLSAWKKWDSPLSKPVIFLSVISYSIYLLHYSIILQLMKNNFDINESKVLTLHLFTAIYILLVVVVSYLMYRLVEKPMMDLRDK